MKFSISFNQKWINYIVVSDFRVRGSCSNSIVLLALNQIEKSFLLKLSPGLGMICFPGEQEDVERSIHVPESFNANTYDWFGGTLDLTCNKKKVDYITCFPSLERNLIFLKIPGRARFIDLNQSLFRLSSKEPLNISAMHDYTHSSKLIMKKG